MFCWRAKNREYFSFIIFWLSLSIFNLLKVTREGYINFIINLAFMLLKVSILQTFNRESLSGKNYQLYVLLILISMLMCCMLTEEEYCSFVVELSFSYFIRFSGFAHV